MRSSSVTKRSPSSPTGRKRGSTSGTFTRARRRWPVSGSRSITPSESERFEMYGNGRPGPTASGVRTGKMLPWNMAASSPRSDAVTSETGMHRDAGGLAARPAAPRACALWRSTSSRMRVPTRSSTSEGSSSPAVRGRLGAVADGLEQLGHAHHAELVEVGREDGCEAQPLEQRDALVAGQLEHARVPLEPRQLAVEEARLLRGLLLPADGHQHSSCDQCECARAQEPAQLAALAGDRLDRGRSRLGERDAHARDGVEEHREIGLVADEHEVVAVALGERRRDRRPRRRAAPQSSATGAPSSSRDDLGRLVCARVRARHDALRLDLQRRQRAARGARGAPPCGHERTLGIGRAERAILGLRMSDEDDCHGVSIDLSAGRHGAALGAWSPLLHQVVHHLALTCSSNALVVAILPGVSDVPLRTLQVRPEQEGDRRPALAGVRGGAADGALRRRAGRARRHVRRARSARSRPSSARRAAARRRSCARSTA